MRSDMRMDFSFGDKKIYNVLDVVQNFGDYFGMSFQELQEMFLQFQVLSWEEVQFYIQHHLDFMWEARFTKDVNMTVIVARRKMDYDFFYKNLIILRDKGLAYLELLEYLASRKNDEDRDLQYENMLEQFEIFHYSSVLSGEHLNKIFIPLKHVFQRFCIYHQKMNTLTTYDHQTVDSFMLTYGRDRIYPPASLVVDVDEPNDRTSYATSKALIKSTKNWN